MASNEKKPPVLVSAAVAYALDALSKATLIDLVADLVLRMEGGDLSDEELLGQIAEYLRPVCRERKQRLPSLLRRWQQWTEAAARYRAEHPEQETPP